MLMDTVVRNGKLVTSDAVFEADIGIKDGRFAALAARGELGTGGRTIDAAGRFILPGAVDEHVHLQDMQRSEVADFTEGTTAAAVGGVTTIMEMPLTVPPTTTRKDFEEKRRTAERKCLVDFALYGGAVPGNLEELPAMVEAGAVGFKAMMAGSVPGLFEILDDGMLLDVFRVLGECRSVLALHAENETLVNHLETKLKAQGRVDIGAFFESRPVFQELEAITRAAYLASLTACHLHVVHVSCPQGVDIITGRKHAGQKITAESGPHYLALSQEQGERLGPYLKFAPPARSKQETDLLWARAAGGMIDTLGSDHGAHPKENKELGWKNIWEAGNGALGLETLLPVMLSEGVNKGRITLPRLVSLVSENPARIFGIYPRKGAIRIGSDADLVMVDLEAGFTVKSDNLHTKQKHTPFEGLEGRGAPVLSMVRGEVVAENGEPVIDPGYGVFVRPGAV
jgi:allantoinase